MFLFFTTVTDLWMLHTNSASHTSCAPGSYNATVNLLLWEWNYVPFYYVRKV